MRATSKKCKWQYPVYFINDNRLQFYISDKISNQLNLLQMKSEQKLGELSKLKQLAPYPIDSSFITGYLAFAVALEHTPEVRDIVTQIILMVQEQLISPHNMLELLIILKYDLLEAQISGKKKTLASIIEPYLSELALDNSYLFRRHFQKDLRQEDIVPESLGIECAICLIDIITSDLSFLGCGHMYHRKCLAEYSKQKISNKHIPFNCPHEGCLNEISQDQINEYLPKELRQKYEEFTFQNYVEKNTKDTSWCPTPGCSAVFAFDAALTEYRCPACKKHYCLACKCEFHTGLSCQEYKEVASLNEQDRKFMMLVKGSKFKQCPNCKFWVQKNEGCDHMTCRCKYEFCYICGGKYNRCKCKGFVNEIQEPRILHPLPSLRLPQPLQSEMPRLARIPHLVGSQINMRAMSSEIDSDESFQQIYVDELMRSLPHLQVVKRKNSEPEKIREDIASKQIRHNNELANRQRIIAEETRLFQQMKREQKMKERQQAELRIKQENRNRLLDRSKFNTQLTKWRRNQEIKEIQGELSPIRKYQIRNNQRLQQERRRENESNARSLRIKQAQSIRMKLQEQRERIQSQLKARGARQLEVKPITTELKTQIKAPLRETELRINSSRSQKVQNKKEQQELTLTHLLNKYSQRSKPLEKKEQVQSNEKKYSFSYSNPNSQADRKPLKLKPSQPQPLKKKQDNEMEFRRFPTFSLLNQKQVKPNDNV